MIRAAAVLSVAALALAALPGVASAETRKVPSETYPTIQSAINGVQNGDVILVSKGTYAENLTISGAAPFTMKGKGKPVIDAGGGIGISMGGVSDVSISGFVIKTASEGIRVSSCSRIVLSKITIPTPTSRGFHFRNNSDRINVSKCSVSGADEEGLLDEESTSLVVTKCKFANTDAAAIALSPNYFTDFSVGSDDAIVTKNKVAGSGAHGIHWGGLRVLVSKNKVSVCSGVGIYNDVDTTTSGSTVEKNKVSTTGNYGICISGSSSTVSKNKIKGTVSTGLYVDGSGQTIEKNKIKNADTFGIEVRGAGGHTFTKNKVSGADIDGFHVGSSGNTFTGNKASKDGQYDLNDEYSEGANTYDGNVFGTETFASGG